MSTPVHKIKDANVRYHDLAASEYDAKWGIDFNEIGEKQVVQKLQKALGRRPPRFATALEIGAGTGYFGINLARAGIVGQSTATDISPGMLRSLDRNARDAGVAVETVCCEAESLPFADASFDLVFGHAILHHIPDLERAFDQFVRVLRPGGAVVFCGEPSTNGDRLAGLPKRIGGLLGPIWRTGVRARPNSSNGHAEKLAEKDLLERVVDVHTFAPTQLLQTAQEAGFVGVRVSGEELLANAFGWLARTLEATAEPESVPYAWRRFVFKSYLALQRVDSALLEKRLPAALFYNLLIAGYRPS